MNKTLKSLEELYTKKEYKQVRDRLLSQKSEIDGGVFHYNLGTIYGKLEDYAASRYNLELALKKGFQSSKVYKNLRFVQQKIPVMDIDSSPAWLDKFMSVSANASYDIFLMFSLMLMLTTLFYIKRKVLRSARFIVLFLGISLIPYLSYIFYFSTLKIGVLLNPSSLREGPSKVYEELDTLPAGSKLIFGEENSGWVLIEKPNSFSGWVQMNNIGFIEE